MIRAEMFRSNGRFVGFHCEGHAKFDRAGRDIVCSAVSALTTAIANGITEVAKVQAGVSANGRDGTHFILAADIGGEDWDRAELLLQTLELGLRAIEREYPRNLKVTIREV